MGKKGRDGAKPRGLPGGRLVRPLRAGGARARELVEKLMKRLLSSRRGRLRTTGAMPTVPKSGRLEAFQRAIEDLDDRAASFDLPVDFTHFRRKLEALLAVLLEVEDDRLVSRAAGPLQQELEALLPRAEAIFIIPETLFGKLDLSLPGLTHVRAACESGDHNRARAALLEHLAGKPVPEGLERWLRRRSSRVLDEAGLVGRGFLRIGTEGWTFFDHPVHWEEVHAPEVHAHAETAVLARAYVETGDESYAKEAVAHLLEWAVRTSLPERPECEESGPWGTACAAGRALNWAAVFVALRSSKAFSPEVARAFLVLVHESAEIVCGRWSARPVVRPDGGRSSGAAGLPAEDMTLVGTSLLVAGTLFDEFKDAPSWKEHGRRLLAGAAGEGVLPDGGWAALGSPRGGPTSLAFVAHERMLDCFVAAALAAPEDDDLARTARAMFEVASATVFPQGAFPGEPHLEAAGARDRVSRLARAGGLLGAEARTPGPTFRVFEDSGVFVMRTGPDEDADSLVFRTSGPLGVHVAVGGREVLRAPGPLLHAGAGTSGQRRGPDLRAGEAEASAAGTQRAGPRSVASLVGPPCDYVRATFGLPGGGVETREVLYVDRRYWVLAVRVRSETGAERTFEVDFFPPECLASPDGRRVVVGTGGRSTLVALAAPTDSGFRLEETPSGRTARAAARGEDVQFIALVYPRHGEEAHAIEVEPVTGPGRAAGLLLGTPDGKHAVGFPHGEEKAFASEGPLGELSPGVQAAALARSDGPWRTLFTIDREAT